MFSVLRSRMSSAIGMKMFSFDDLEHAELESNDSVCISELAANRIDSKSSMNSDRSLPPNYEEYAKRKVIKILKSLKKLDRDNEGKPKMPMLVFIDVIRDHQYKNVSMNLFSTFMETCKMVPKDRFLHYYMYFLFYASYYHHMRSINETIGDKMRDSHRRECLCIRSQLKYLQYIIKESRIREVTL